MSAQDKFKPLSPMFQIYKDGETVRAKKLNTYIENTQIAFDALGKAIGDSLNAAVTFSGLPLFQNNIGRSIGPMDNITLIPLRVFGTPNLSNSLQRGLIKYPWSEDSSIDAGSKSLNLIPNIDQTNKIGIGCTYDNGNQCLRRFDNIYNEEKNLLDNGSFTDQLAEWNVSGVLFSNGFPDFDLQHRYNTLTYSSDFERWDQQNCSIIARAMTDPLGTSDASAIHTDEFNDTPVSVSIINDSSILSADWCFSVWLASPSGTIAFLEIENSIAISGSFSGSATPNSSQWAVETTPALTRYYVYGNYPVTTSGIRAKVYKSILNPVDTDDLFIWGAQLEPTKYPSQYIQTNGTMLSGFVGEVSLSQDVETISKHLYQVRVNFTSLNTPYTITANGNAIYTGSLSQNNVLYTADSALTSFQITVSGTVNTNKLSLFSVDAGYPCHAMNCPGFSAYEKVRKYQAVLPNITQQTHQNFGSKLALPDDLDVAQVPELPENILGIFDHEQNHTVPNRMVKWELSSWPLGGPVLELMADPEFLTNWSTAGDDEYPSDFGVLTEAGGGILDRVEVSTTLRPTTPTTWLDFDNNPGGSNDDGIRISGTGTGTNTGGIPWPTTTTTDTGSFVFDIWFKTPVGSGWMGTFPFCDLYHRGATSSPGGSDFSMWAVRLHKDGWFGIHHILPFWGSAAVNLINYPSSHASVPYYYVSGTTSVFDGEWHHGRIVLVSGTGGGQGGGNGPVTATLQRGTWIYVWVDGEFESSGIFVNDFGNTNNPADDYFPTYDWNVGQAGDLDGEVHIAYNDANAASSVAFSGSIGGFRILKGYESISVDGDGNIYNWLNTRTPQSFTPEPPQDWEVEANSWAIYRIDENTGTIINDIVAGRDGDFLAGARAPSWASGIPMSLYTGDPTDRMSIDLTDVGAKGITRSFTLADNSTYTWTYKIRSMLPDGDVISDNIFERYDLVFGSVEVDQFLNGNWTTVTSSGLENTFMVDGVTSPGASEWAEESNGWWTIKHRVRSLADSTSVILTLAGSGVAGSIEGEIDLELDNFSLTRTSSSSTRFKYDCAPVLGLNWEGFANHVREENLFKLSENMELWNISGNVEIRHGDPLGTATAVRIIGEDGYLNQTIKGNMVLDPTMTLSFYARSNIPGNGMVAVMQNDGPTYNLSWHADTSWEQHSFVISGLVQETGEDVLFVICLPESDECVFWRPQLVHGSGLVDYVPTGPSPVAKYRYQIDPYPKTIDSAWSPGYALVNGGLIQTELAIDAPPNGTAFSVLDTRGFPDTGVVRIGSNEFGYRQKSAMIFEDTITGWRGTSDSIIGFVSGLYVTNVSIPQDYDSISEDQIITFPEPIAAPPGDWANTLSLQLYNIHQSNLDRFSLQASAVPLTRSVGNLLTSFGKHISDHRRHLRKLNICGLLLDASTWASFPDLGVEVTVPLNQVIEIDQTAVVNITARRFNPTSLKTVIISWGDGATTTISGRSNVFNNNQHIYDLRQYTLNVIYTINVIIRDEDLDFSRETNVSIRVLPKQNSAGIITKHSTLSATKIKLLIDNTTKAGALIKAKSDSSAKSSFKITV